MEKNMRKRRSRVLSEEGKKLLCVAYEPPVLVKTKCHRLSSIFFDLITSKYDIRMEETVRLFREGSEALMSQLDTANLSQCMDNALYNVLGLIMHCDRRTLRPADVKHNIRWYLNIAVRAMQTKDHNTAVLLRSVLAHSAIRRLRLTSKTMSAKMLELEKEYGTFLDCQKNHVRKILATEPTMFRPGSEIPSAMVLDMFTRQTKAHVKAFHEIGKMPRTLTDTHQKLKGYATALLHNFKEKKGIPLIPLYDVEPEMSHSDVYALSRTLSQKKR
jgi:hypothetical protein